MHFEEILDQAMAMLQRRGRVSYRTLKLQFHLDEEALEALKEELIEVHHLAVDQDGRMLVWARGVSPTPVPSSPHPPQQAIPHVDPSPALTPPTAAQPPPPEAERRQLTILFCDLVSSTALSRQLDPEDYRTAVRAYQAACAPVIERFDGHIAQYLGDGLLVYFGYPLAHEDDAQRAVRTGLAMLEAMGALATRLEQQHGARLAIRVGMPTGPVVVGEMGAGGRREQLALGETPNVAGQLFDLAQRQHDSSLLLGAHYTLGQLSYQVGAFAPARTYLEQGLALSAPQRHATPHTTPWWDQNLGVCCRARMALVMWDMGYPEQAVQWSQEALALAHTLAHPYSLSETLLASARLHGRCREWQTAQVHAEAALALATEHGFARYMVLGVLYRGMALAAQGQGDEGLAQMRQGLAALRTMGTGAGIPAFLARLAAACGQVGQVEEGLHLLAEALVMVNTTGEHRDEAELHRLHGELLLLLPVPDAPAAEACFQQAHDVARRQQAKSWELRATMSLACLWQRQGKRAEAYELLAPIYGWFTEGFDTADLQDAKVLLEELRA